MDSSFLNPGDVVILKKLNPKTLDVIHSRKYPKKITIHFGLFLGQHVWARKFKTLIKGDQVVQFKHPVTSPVMAIKIIEANLLQITTVNSTYYIEKVIL